MYISCWLEQSERKKLMNLNAAMLKKQNEIELEAALADTELTNEDRKILDLMDNEEFLNQIAAAKSEAEIQQLFQEQGIKLTEEQVDEFVKEVQDKVLKIACATDELTDDELAEIAGGSFSSFFKSFGKYLLGAVVSVVVGAITGGIGGAIVGGLIGAAIQGGSAYMDKHGIAGSEGLEVLDAFAEAACFMAAI